MEIIPEFLAVAAENSTTHNFQESCFTTSYDESLFIIPPAWSTKDTHVSPVLVSKIDPEALYVVSFLFFTSLVASIFIVGGLFLLEHYRQFQLQKVLLSRRYFCGTPLKDVCSPLKVQCCIMLDDQFKFDCIQCPKGHWVGRDALQRHVEFEALKPLDVTGGKIKCPSCENHYSDQSLAFFCGPQAFQTYQTMRQTKVLQEQRENIFAEMEENARKEERAAERKIIQDAIRNQFKLGDGTYHGYMCPTCGFGPVDHMECDDLVAHHGEFKDYGIEIDNSCPMCLWYGEEKTDWGEWKGEFLEGEQLEATQKAVDEYKIPFEEFKDETLARLHELKGLLTVANVSQRYAMLQQIAPREFPETSNNVSYCEKAEDPSEIHFQLRNNYSNMHRARLQKHLIKTMDSFRRKNLKSEFKYKDLKKEQTELVQELKDRRQAMKDNIQEAVVALGYDIEVTHPPPEDDF